MGAPWACACGVVWAPAHVADCLSKEGAGGRGSDDCSDWTYGSLDQPVPWTISDGGDPCAILYPEKNGQHCLCVLGRVALQKW